MKAKEPQQVSEIKQLNNFVSRAGARSIFAKLTTCPHTTGQLLTELLAAASEEERCLQSAVRRNALRSCLAATWECARYGWQMSAFGRLDRVTFPSGQIRCRRTLCLMRAAIACGSRIATAQAGQQHAQA